MLQHFRATAMPEKAYSTSSCCVFGEGSGHEDIYFQVFEIESFPLDEDGVPSRIPRRILYWMTGS